MTTVVLWTYVGIEVFQLGKCIGARCVANYFVALSLNDKEVEEACSGGKKGLLVQFVDISSFVPMLLNCPRPSLSTPWNVVLTFWVLVMIKLLRKPGNHLHAMPWPAKVLKHSDYRRLMFFFQGVAHLSIRDARNTMGTKGRPEWHPGLVVPMVRMAKWGEGLGRWECLPPMGLEVMRIKPWAMRSSWRKDFRMLKNTSFGGVS
jgi:hypothetical protein